MEQIDSLDIDWPHHPQPDRFAEKLRAAGMGALHRGLLQTLQINVGKLCNQTCRHCHVEAGPTRKEIMPEEIVERMITLAAARSSTPTRKAFCAPIRHLYRPWAARPGTWTAT